MGDRRHATIDDGAGPRLFLYVHHDGHRLAHIIRDALIRGRDRWDDPPYLARIIASRVFVAAGIDSTLGAGLGTDYMEAPADDDIHIDMFAQSVRIDQRTWTFGDYTKATDRDLDR